MDMVSLIVAAVIMAVSIQALLVVLAIGSLLFAVVPWLMGAAVSAAMKPVFDAMSRDRDALEAMRRSPGP